MDPALLKERELFKLKASAIPVYVLDYYSILINLVVIKIYKNIQHFTSCVIIF